MMLFYLWLLGQRWPNKDDKDVQTTNIQNTFILCLLRFLWYVMFIQDMRNNMKRTPIELVDTAFEVYIN